MTTQFYKLAQPDGFDFKTGNTINYRENIGKTVVVPTIKKYKPNQRSLCSDSVLHASRNINDCFIGASIPCSVYIVDGRPVVDSKEKSGFIRLKIIEEIEQIKLNSVFGWNYSEVCNPVNPLMIKAPIIGGEQLMLLKQWASVGDSVGASVGASVGDSVGDSVGASIWDSVGDSIWDSIWDSVWAYIGSLFPNIKTWKYTSNNTPEYPYQSGADLWRQGIIPSFDGEKWRLHTGSKATVVYEISKTKLLEDIKTQ